MTLGRPDAGCGISWTPAELETEEGRDLVRSRLEDLGRELAEQGAGGEQQPLLALIEDRGRDGEALRDALSTGVMDLYRRHQGRAAFGLLYELNRAHLVQQVASRLRRYQSKADPGDVLQEVFFNIYRYPHRFDASREDAFRLWSSTIVRNTVLKHLRSLSRSGRAEVPFEDLSEHPEGRQTGPLGGAIERESQDECGRVYLTYLHLYLEFYSMLSERERRAIHLVEVDERSYREAAAELGIKLENLKMVIFRARRKIHRAMRRVFEGLPPDCRPAREPRPALESPAPVGPAPVGPVLEKGSRTRARNRTAPRRSSSGGAGPDRLAHAEATREDGSRGSEDTR